MQKKRWQKEIVYQIYPRSFKDSNADGIGDILGIVEKLDYLKDLGITMIWLCPIYKSPMADNGYDISDYFDINEEFGTMEDFDLLVGEAKKRDIKIMMDLVLNHTSNEHEWFKKALSDKNSPYRDYYIIREGKDLPNNWRSIFGGSTWTKIDGEDAYYFHSFAKEQPDLNWENPKLREEIINIVNFWIDKGITAFRMDAINHIKKDHSYKSGDPDGADGRVSVVKFGRNQEGVEDLIRILSENTFKIHDSVTVGETAGLSYDKYANYIGDDGVFSMVFDFIPANFDVVEETWYKRLDWKVSDFRKAIFDSQESIQKYGWSANFIENHDQPRATTKILREKDENIDAIKMLGGIYFFFRGTPYIYQGQELGMKNFVRESKDDFQDIQSIDSYNRTLEEGFSEKEALYFTNLRSRDNPRVPFAWTGEKYGGFSETKPWLAMAYENPELNAEDEKKDKDSVLNFYRKMIDFRQNSQYSDILIYGDFKPLEGFYEEIIAYERILDDKKVEIIANFSEEEKSVEAKGKDIIFSNSKGEIIADKLSLSPYGFVILAKVENK